MKKSTHFDIEFPANPFIVVADFLTVVLLLMMLAVLHQSISSNNVLKRLAIQELQDRIGKSKDPKQHSELENDPVLYKALQNNDLLETQRDGDLQRFWLNGELCFTDNDPTHLSADGRNLIQHFSAILARHQGPSSSPENGWYKYILVEGHADRSEGDPQQVAELSFARALDTESCMESAHLSNVLIKAYPRESLDPWFKYFSEQQLSCMTKVPHLLRNRRVEIVIVYSGDRAIESVSVKR